MLGENETVDGLCTNRLSWVEGGMSIGEVGGDPGQGEGGAERETSGEMERE